MSEIVERLRLHSSWRDSHGELNDAPNEAADHIEKLEAENAAHRASLEKMAEVLRNVSSRANAALPTSVREKE